MNRPLQRALPLAVLALLAACGEEQATGGEDAGNGPVTTVQRVLTRAGPGLIEAHPSSDRIPLRVLLSQEPQGGVAGSKVTFKFTAKETDEGAELDDTSIETGTDGTGEVGLIVHTPGEYKIKAESPGATSKAVWTIDVQKLRKTVSIVASNETFPLPTDATQATVAAGAGRQIVLAVRVTAATESGDEPLSGEEVTFDVGPGAVVGAKFVLSQSGGDTSQTADVTQADGKASVILAVGDAASAQPYTITASLASNESATFRVTVTSGANTGDGCQSTSQCPPGRICQAGHCIDPGVGGSCGGNDRPCPIGYHCDSGSGDCVPGAAVGCGTCPEGQLCDESTGECTTGGCTTDAECPDGFHCQTGVCAPNPTDGSIDVTGHWYTKHTFNIADALPDWVRTVGGAIRGIDQALLGQLNLPGWINALVSGLLRQYIPEWVYTVVDILDNLFTMFSMLRSEGEMDLVANGGPRILAGSEYWSSFVFYLLSQCHGQIAGNIWQPPACARFDIATDELSQADLAINVKPFSAKLVGTGPWQVEVDKRQVEMKLAGLLKFVVDKILEIATGYPALEDKKCCTGTQVPGPICAEEPNCGAGSGALSHLVDCEGVSEFVNGIFPVGDVTGLCTVGVSAIGKVVADQLLKITLTSKDLLEFDGKATAKPGRSALEAEELGERNADALDNSGRFTQNPGDGLWNGRFHLGIGIKNVPGRWYGSRNPLQ